MANLVTLRPGSRQRRLHPGTVPQGDRGGGTLATQARAAGEEAFGSGQAEKIAGAGVRGRAYGRDHPLNALTYGYCRIWMVRKI